MPLSCPLCSASLGPSELEGHLRHELRLPLLSCAHCPQSFCDETDAQGHFRGPFAKHPGAPPDLIRRPEKPSQTARLLELLRLARGGPDAVQQRLCVCGQCRLICREEFRPVEPASEGIHAKDAPNEQRQPEKISSEIGRPALHAAPETPFQLKGESPPTEEPDTDQWFPTEVEPPDQASEVETPMTADVKPNLAELKPQLVTDGKVSCLQCGKRQYRNLFATHVRLIHIPGNPIQCLLCPKSAKLRKEMVAHQKKSHGVELSNETCSESVTMQMLRDWIKLCFGEVKGIGYKSFHCRPCDKAVTINQSKKHIATKHLRKPLHRCKTCDCTSFNSDPQDVNVHVRKVHKLQPGPDTVDSGGLQQYAPIIKAMIHQLFDR